MNPLQKAGCRLFQWVMHAALPLLPYREPETFSDTDAIVPLLKRLGVRTVLLVTDRGLRSTGLTAPLERLLADNAIRCAVYDDTSANPTVQNVEDARALYVQENAEALIAFGGGSPMDCAKAVGARIAHPNRSLGQLKGLLKVIKKIPPLIAIPTTAGTGSEVTITAVITDREKRYKYTMNDFTLIPRYAVLDARVTYTLPPALTATTGMDALTHAVEAYIGRSTSRETRRLARETVELVFRNLETAYQNGSDHAARENMLRAAYRAGIAFSKSYVGYIHAVAHSLGGQYDLPHGLTNAVLMPIVLESYGAAAHKKLHELGIVAGVASAADTPAEGAEKFIRAIRELNHRLGIPETLPGIRPEDIPEMARHAAKEANPLYPVPKLMNAKELEIFYARAAEGR